MDSSHQAAKRKVDEISIQNQDDSMPIKGEDGGDYDESKRFKQGLHPLQMDIIMKKVLSFLDVESIKIARQVKELWRDEGAKILFSKCYVSIPWVLQIPSFSNKRKVIEDFKAFLSCKSSNQTSMIPYITIGADGDLELWKSLKVLGPQVKSVNLKFYDGEAKLLRNIFEVFPNLNQLNFENIKRFTIQNVERVFIKVLVTVMSTKKNDRCKLFISGLDLCCKNVEQVADMEKFADCNNIIFMDLQVNILPKFFRGVPNCRARIASMLGKLLNTSRDTLKKLDLRMAEFFLPLLEFPCMTAITDINLEFSPESTLQLSECKFAPSFRFYKMVPNLEKIEIKYSQYPGLPSKTDFFENMFKNTGEAPSVKRLKFSKNYFDVAVEPLLKTFPMVQELEICTNPTVEYFHSLWTNETLVNLKKLHLWINLDELIDDLDWIFTGFSPETVDMVKKARNLDLYTLKKLEKLREYPSILKLKELEHLTISFQGSGANLWPWTLVVSGKYAFKMLPKNPNIIFRSARICKPLYNGLWPGLDEVSKLPNVVVKWF